MSPTTGGKKNKDKDGPSRFKKDLLLYKNQALGPEHRVIIIGTTKSPENGDVKDMKTFFDRFLFMPYPDYSSRVLIWKYYLSQKIREGLKAPTEGAAAAASLVANGGAGGVTSAAAQPKAVNSHLSRAQQEEEIALKVRLAMEKIDVSSLANVSEGYSAGAIARTIRIVVTHRRVAMIRLRPLSNLDFIDNLSFQDVNYHDDKATFLDFTRTITGLLDRRKRVEAIVSGESEQKKGGDKKKK